MKKTLSILAVLSLAACAYTPPPNTVANYTGGVYDGGPSVKDSLPFQPERAEEGVGSSGVAE